MLLSRQFHSVQDARSIARKRLPWMIFDYIDGAAGAETGAIANRAAFDALKLRPRILRNVENRNLAKTVLSQATQLPFGIAPMGMCNISAPGADLMMARLAAKTGMPHCVSTASTMAMR